MLVAEQNLVFADAEKPMAAAGGEARNVEKKECCGVEKQFNATRAPFDS